MRQLAVAVGIGRDRDGRQLATDRVDQAGAVRVAVGIDSDHGVDGLGQHRHGGSRCDGDLPEYGADLVGDTTRTYL
ncbi:hypothetical protein [Nonomuraea dietziae]|uniref:hypothetical protein n=1 Tax=Nonomuraea dietziae TaxID=65515 RepID=UPI0031DFB5BF